MFRRCQSFSGHLVQSRPSRIRHSMKSIECESREKARKLGALTFVPVFA